MLRIKPKNIHYGTLFLLTFFFLIGPSAFNIQYRSEITDYFHAADPALLAFQSTVNEFQLGDAPTILIELNHQALLSRDALLDFYGIVRDLESLPGINSTHSLLDTPLTDSEGNTLSARQAIKNGVIIDDVVLGQIANNAADHFFLASPQHSMVAISIDLNDQSHYTHINTYLKNQSQRTIKSYYITGPLEIKQALQFALQHDLTRLMPLVLIIGLVFLWYFLRSWWLIFSGVLSIIVALGITAGISGYSGIVINQTSSLAFSIVFIIALADIIHLLVGYRQRLVEDSSQSGSHNSIIGSLSTNAVALLLTSITTCIGFLSLNTSHSPVFATFGNIAAIGVIFSYLSAITLTVSLVLLHPLSNKVGSISPLTKLVSYFSNLGNNLSSKFRMGFYIICIGAGVGILLINTHNDPIDYFPDSFDIKKASNISNEAFGVHHPLYLRITAIEKEGLLEHSFLTTLKRFQFWVESQPNVTTSHSFINTLGMLQPSIRQLDLKWSSPPSNNQVVTDLLNLQQMGSDKDNSQHMHVNPDFTSMLVTLATTQLSSNELIQLQLDINAWFESNAPRYQIALTGHGMLFANVGKSLTYNMLIGGLLSAFVICLLMGIFLGNVRIAIIAFIPNLIPATLVFGLWGWVFGNIDLAAAGTLSISLGIVVDDSIHILKHYIAYRQSGKSPQRSTELTLQQVGPALFLTTAVISIGMGILVFSVFGPNQTTAIFLTAIISVALLFDLIMLPHLLNVFDKWLFPFAIQASNQPKKSSLMKMP